ncbi:hypothetical protein [Glaciimonas sp. PAMC28666]|uniref:hypothetical protein n=1 Tax=Glaciimonas sp. PAMC28666 TaxID=2807626 RepID=UPI001962D42C|nr:hypothetical protein [Glaciimonas sp. PAMC28666]QRX84172.1 hypothetical protein JQN73_08280 [Glaciimonas sp. PAMC28666]
MNKPNDLTFPVASTSESIHEAFSWLPPHQRTDPHAQFVAQTKDICLGVQTCIDLAHFSMMDRESEDSDTIPVLNIEDTERLLRLASTSSKLLADVASAEIDRMDQGTDDTHSSADAVDPHPYAANKEINPKSKSTQK